MYKRQVRLQLPSANIVGKDAADALAIALCHAHHSGASEKLNMALAKVGA